MTWLRALPLALLLVHASGSLASTPAGGPSPAPSAPRSTSSGAASRGPVVVTIIVDQLAAWIADARWPLLPRDGGFARLVREGTLVRQMRYAHACTDTAPGHAALYTGATPRVSGIFANEWIDDRGDLVSIVGDATARIVPGSSPQVGSSLRSLRVDTIADRLRGARPDATIASLSLKERAAVFAGGRRPDATVWYERSLGRFVSSTAFHESWPEWLPALASAPLAAPAQSWELLDASFVRANAASPDAEPGEGDVAGLGTTFPHPAPKPEIAASAFRISPRADEVLLEIALAAVDRRSATGRTGAPALIAVSLSTNDYVGHVFGPDSFEAWDELRHLDAALARFFAALDEKLGADGWAAILSADHGVATLPEVSRAAAIAADCRRPETPTRPRRSCAAGSRLFADALHAAAARAAATALGAGDWIQGVADPYVVYTAAARRLDSERRARLDAAVVGALSASPDLERVVALANLPKVCPPEQPETLDGLICESYPPGAPGDVYLVPREGTFVDTGIAAGRGSSHGTPHPYDRTVPLVVRAPGRVPAGRVVDGPIGFRAFARTVSALLDVAPPDAAREGVDLAAQPRPP
jgi:arylsulfatase A-like enzyme